MYVLRPGSQSNRIADDISPLVGEHLCTSFRRLQGVGESSRYAAVGAD
jgi:hypothetical protein